MGYEYQSKILALGSKGISKFIKIFMIVICIFYKVNSWAQNKTINLVADSWPPFSDKNSPSGGLSVEIAKEALKERGYSIRVHFVPWPRALQEIASGASDVLPEVWLTHSNREFLHCSEPYAYNDLKFIKKKGSDFEYQGLDSLKGKTVGVVRDYGYTDEFDMSTVFKKEGVTDQILNIKKLLAGRIDLAIDDPVVVERLVKSESEDLFKEIEFTKNSLALVPLYFCAGKSSGKNKEIVTDFNSGLERMKNDGTYDRLLKKYGVRR